MLNALIVDDEDFVLEGLKHAVDWDRFGIRVCGEANNGLEALTFIDDFRQPLDIVITDIKMPVMDGFGLIKALSERQLACKIIVLTGHEEFDFARQAIHYRVFEYLMKPVVLERIEDAIIRLAEECRRETEARHRSADMERKLLLGRPMLEQQFFHRLIHGVADPELQQSLGLKLEAEGYQAIIAHIDPLKQPISFNTARREADDQVLSQRVYAHLSAKLAEYFPIVPQHVGPNEWVLLILYPNKRMIGQLEAKLVEVQIDVALAEERTITFAIGGAYDDPISLARSYREAQEALKHKLYYGNASMIFFSDIEHSQGIYADPFRETKQSLNDAVNLCDLERASRMLDDIRQSLLSGNYYRTEFVRNLSMELALIVLHALHEKREKAESVWPDAPDLIDCIQRLETLDDIFDTLRDAYASAIRHLERKSDAKNRHTIAFIVDYIGSHLDSDIKLDDLAQKVYLTPNYLGYLFKETMNVGFAEYVTGRRMEHAKKLLAEPGSRINEVALKVGYKNPHYFSKLFKEYTGQLPSAYK